MKKTVSFTAMLLCKFVPITHHELLTVKESIEILLTAKHEQENSAVNNLPHGRDVMAVLATGFCKSMSFTVFHCSRSPDKFTVLLSTRNSIRCYFTVKVRHRRQNFRNIIAELLLMFCVIEDFDLVTKRSLAIEACTCFNQRKLQ